MIKPIKPNRLVNIVRNVASNSSNRLQFFCLIVICCICQSNELNVKLNKKMGRQVGGPAKSLGGPWPTEAPLRTATVVLSLLCDVRHSTMEKL